MYKVIISLLLTLGLCFNVSAQEKTEKKKKKSKKTITADPDAKLQSPKDVAFDEKSGLFYISSPGNNGVIKRGRRGGAVFAVKDLDNPRGVLIYSGVLYVADAKKLKAFSIKSEEMLFEVEIPEAKELYSLTTDGSHVYVSDNIGNAVYEVDLKKKSATLLTKDVPSPTGLYYSKKNRDIIILSSLEEGGGIYTYNFKEDKVALALAVEEFPYLEDITFNGSMSYYITAFGADKKENVIIKANDALSREPRVIQSTADGPAGLKYIKRTNELAIANDYGNNLNIIKLGY
ncbi:hypothetical protein KMW28_15250 [Flammeovirga yaeyamensis]|uniref:Uncharacterized protein n=1 Tax=Flammeovirga yaeyamensis TaxID=367791 RepID=A0AAX1N105_9BACT|nr:hypothetical protein [Flammeovirga yaeyamensis]MBB3698634.1 DNA-binding beta-propeller fold protein YncE [Flammeovirga yaeyamensis]NMF34019.1 hypothetical protein [Flammeovirga yaeyamensis]QWG01007.1 hypothetical protein KMW28_15250 [Flammeovirga yaeyamensis]